MSNVIAGFSVGDEVRVVFGAFEGLCGTVVEIEQPTGVWFAFGEPHSSTESRYLVKMGFAGREFVIDFPFDALVSKFS
jgi:transcription antitermination factor NusG